MPRSRGHRALRKGRVSLPGQIYLVTTTTAHRRPLFTDPIAARATCRCMIEPACWRDAHVLCWVLMPDHWHGLVQLDDNGDLSGTMNRWKSMATKNVHRRGRRDPVWARGFHDHALRREEGIIDAARYIVANPVRAGIVSDVLAYPYWDCIWLQPHRRRVDARIPL